MRDRNSKRTTVQYVLIGLSLKCTLFVFYQIQVLAVGSRPRRHLQHVVIGDRNSTRTTVQYVLIGLTEKSVVCLQLVLGVSRGKSFSETTSACGNKRQELYYKNNNSICPNCAHFKVDDICQHVLTAVVKFSWVRKWATGTLCARLSNPSSVDKMLVAKCIVCYNTRFQFTICSKDVQTRRTL